MSAVTPEVREIVLTRAMGICEYCYGPVDGPFGYSCQHRACRGMGGSRDLELGAPVNILVLCGSGTTGCHGWAEHNPRAAQAHGLALRTGSAPETTPFRDHNGTWWLLRDDTKIHLAPTGVFSDFTTADDIGRMLTTVGGSS